MLSEREIGYLRQILREIDLSRSFVEGLGPDDFERYAVIRCLEVISEASSFGAFEEPSSRHPVE